jgi:hypothetical protein
VKGALFAIAVVAAASTCTAAEPYSFTVPGKGWALKMSLPRLAAYQAEDSEQGFRFMATSAADEGIAVSFFVEGASAPDSQSCRSEYWASASRNPMITKETVQLVDFGGKPGVRYVIEGEYQGQHVKSQNAHVYIAHGGTCIDIHASRFPFEEGADEKLALIVSSATVEGLQ